MRVRTLELNKTNTHLNFVKCSCFKWKRRGYPCSCFFRVVDNGKTPLDEMMDISMIDVRSWKAFSAYYGDESKMGDLLMQAQNDSFLYEKEGIQISSSLCSRLEGCEDLSYPILGPNTTADDFEEMDFVSSGGPVTHKDLLGFRDDCEELTLSQLMPDEREKVNLSHVATKLQKRVKKASKVSNETPSLLHVTKIFLISVP